MYKNEERFYRNPAVGCRGRGLFGHGQFGEGCGLPLREVPDDGGLFLLLPVVGAGKSHPLLGPGLLCGGGLSPGLSVLASKWVVPCRPVGQLLGLSGSL